MENPNFSQNEIDIIRRIDIPPSNDNDETEDHFISIYSSSKIEYFYFEIVINTIFIESFGLLLAGFVLMNLQYYFFMALWMFYDCGFAIFIIHQLKQENNKKIRLRMQFYLLEKLFIFIYKIIMISLIEGAYIYSIFSSVPLACYIGARIYIYFTESYSMDANSFHDCLVIALRLYFLIQNIILNVKMDGWVSWNWKEIFWSYWVFFSVALGMDVSVLMMILNRFCMGFFEEMNFLEVKGLIWVFILVSRLAASSCIFVLGLINYLDSKEDTTLQIYVCFSLVSSLIFVLISICLKADIVKILNKVYSNNMDTDRSIEGSLREQRVEKKMQQPPLHIENKTFSIPKFLLKFSSTYFKRTNEKNPKDFPHNSNSSRKTKTKISTQKAKVPLQKNFSYRKKSNSMENRDFIKIMKSNLPIIDGFKKISNEFATTLNTHIAIENSSFGTFQNNENEEEEKKNRLVSLQSDKSKFKEKNATLKSDRKCVVDDLQEENFHHFPKEIINKPMNMNESIINSDNKKKSLGKKKRLGIPKTKSLQIIADEGIIESTTEREVKNMIKDPFIREEMKDSKENSTARHSCLICYEEKPDAVLMECGHGGICYKCGVELLKKLGECPLCRKNIDMVYKIDLEGQRKKFIKILCSSQLKNYNPGSKHNNH